MCPVGFMPIYTGNGVVSIVICGSCLLPHRLPEQEDHDHDPGDQEQNEAAHEQAALARLVLGRGVRVGGFERGLGLATHELNFA